MSAGLDLAPHAVPDLGVADDSPPAADLGATGLELRLDEQHHRSPRLAHGDQRRDDQSERDERKIADHEVDRSADRRRVDLADVGALDVLDPGSARSRSWSWPCPTSTATTLAAPRCSRQSVKPPVDAPASSARMPATSIPNVVQGVLELEPAAPDESGRWAGDDAAGRRAPPDGPACRRSRR